MLPRENRLRQRRDFSATYSRGRRFDLPCLALYVRRTDAERVRLGFTVGRKVGSAVVRNRVKRLLRESCRLMLDALRPGFDGVFVARACLRGKSYSEVRAMVAELLQRAGLMSGNKRSDGMEHERWK